MKRLPLFLIIIISGVSLAVLTPFIIAQWLLGGNKPLDNYIKAVDTICFPDDH